MLRVVRRLRVARLLALLAVLLTVGVGRHVHAPGIAPADAGAVVVLLGGDDGAGGEAEPFATHCGLCHAVRGVLPGWGGARAPVALAARVSAPLEAGPAALPVPDVPSPPPRPVRATA